MQILGGSGPSPSLAAAALGRGSLSLQGVLSYFPALALLQHTEGRRVAARALRGPSRSGEALGWGGPGAALP